MIILKLKTTFGVGRGGGGGGVGGCVEVFLGLSD